MKNTFVLCLILLVAYGCTTKPSPAVTQVAENTPPAPIQTIRSIRFHLPKQYAWQSEKGKGKNVTIFQLKDLSPSPLKVIYQRIPRVDTPAMLASKVITPLRKSCHQSALSIFHTHSHYPEQISHEVLCNQIKGTPFGMVSYLDIFSDAHMHHLLIVEVKTPKSQQLGQLTRSEHTASHLQLIFTAQKIVTEVAVCDTQGRCL